MLRAACRAAVRIYVYSCSTSINANNYLAYLAFMSPSVACQPQPGSAMQHHSYMMMLGIIATTVIGFDPSGDRFQLSHHSWNVSRA